MKGVVVFDVCGTLYNSNTTIDFILYLARRRSCLRFMLLRFLMLKPVAYLLIKLGFRLKDYMISNLAGYTRAEMEEKAEVFFDEYLASNINSHVFQRFLKHREIGHKIFLASASIDAVISVVAKRLNVDFASSQLGYCGKLCTGFLSVDITGEKNLYFPQLADDEYLLAMYTDNHEDLELVNYFCSFYYWKRNTLFSPASLVCLKGGL